ncbi:MAG: hypothetical protein GWP10_06130, partial [Nitrospiraceae bacterium]|nr:hypothetical protein [Nitrospiraceae bacterium]
MKMGEEENKGLSNWNEKTAEEKVREVEVAFPEDFGGEEVSEVSEEVSEVSEEVSEVSEEASEVNEVGQKYGGMTKEEQKERNIDILLGLGFQKGQDRGDGKERFYLQLGDGITVGRTFNGEHPTGMFWAKKGDRFLSQEEIKELPIIKQFYAIRAGEAPLPQIQKVQKVEPERRIMEGSLKVRGGFYSINGRSEPDAWTVQQWANKSGVSIEVREAV